jgi:hypothetical protein
MKQFGVVLCVLVAVALLAYYGTRQPLISTAPPTGLQTSVVPPPNVTTDRDLGQIASQRAQVDVRKVDGIPAASEPEWGRSTRTENCETIDGLPDSACTPGDIDHSETAGVICSQDFHTGSVRDKATTRTQKNRVYRMYSIAHPSNNTGRGQVCEIDHLVSLELGGADTMANLWPECSTGYMGWQGPGFRDKDGFENYLWYHVCVNRDLALEEAQRQIATNWRQYWEVAGEPRCRNRANCK